MDKSEAIAVLHEILGVCRESVNFVSISLDSRCSNSEGSDGEYVIRLKGDFDKCLRTRIAPVLEKHTLAMKLENGYVIISNP